MKFFKHDCQNYSLLAHRSTLRKVIFFEIFKLVFGLWSIIVQPSGKKFQQRCPNCILRVQRTSRFSFAKFCHVSFNFVFERKKILVLKKVSSNLSKLHSKRPRTFWGIFFSKSLFLQFSMEFEQRFFQLCRNFSTKLSKMNFTCPENHFEKNIKLTLWNNFRLWERKRRICGGKFAALLSNLHFCLQMGNWKNSFERIFTFFDCFRTSKNIFWFFRRIIQGMVVQTEFYQPRGTYPIRKNLRENFCPLRTMSAVFWTFIEVF